MTLLDARGFLCPVPVIRARERLRTLSLGETLEVLCDDPMAPLDLRVFCEREGHAVLETREEVGGGWRVVLEKRKGPV